MSKKKIPIFTSATIRAGDLCCASNSFHSNIRTWAATARRNETLCQSILATRDLMHDSCQCRFGPLFEQTRSFTVDHPQSPDEGWSSFPGFEFLSSDGWARGLEHRHFSVESRKGTLGFLVRFIDDAARTNALPKFRQSVAQVAHGAIEHQVR